MHQFYQSLLIKASNERKKRLENNNINGDDDNETTASGFPDQCELNAEINLNGKVKYETKCSINKMHVEMKII